MKLALKAARVGSVRVLRARHRAAVVDAGPGSALHRGAGAGMVPTVVEEHKSDPDAVRVRCSRHAGEGGGGTQREEREGGGGGGDDGTE